MPGLPDPGLRARWRKWGLWGSIVHRAAVGRWYPHGHPQWCQCSEAALPHSPTGYKGLRPSLGEWDAKPGLGAE